MRRAVLPGTLLAVLAAPAPAQVPRVGIIDFYGLREVSERRVRQALRLREGDSLTLPPDAARRRVEAVPGVERARVELVCCEGGKSILYVGIAERTSPVLEFHPAPMGRARLPSDVVADGAAFDRAFTAAVLRGDAEEDASRGHSLMRDPATRAVQERFAGYAARDLPRLRDVLRRAADPRERALAAQVIGYAPDKETIVADLVLAMRDPGEEVRNNAMRALAAIARHARESPAAGVRVPFRPFVDLLGSLVWTDLNKASWALLQLTATRDSAALASIRERALLPLGDMARWKSPAHAVAAFFLLGRAAGLAEETIEAAWERGDRDAVLDAALGGRPAR